MYLMETDNRILLRLERGEEIVSTLQNFAGERRIPNAMLLGIGAIENPELGAYHLDTRKYSRERFPGSFELVNLTGNLGYADGSPILHAHVTLTDHDFNAFGGHLFEAKVYATVEIALWPGQNLLQRKMVDEIGLKLWDLPNKVGPSSL
jgi:predicted DNA-binding protein with PD1-like motif